VDSETPEYIVLSWMAPQNRISTLLALLRIDAVYNELSDRTYLVQSNGRLAEATFRPMWQLLRGTTLSEHVRAVRSDGEAGSVGVCLHERMLVLDRSFW
jgi:hypothetical protein